jgi:hypothetical protein
MARKRYKPREIVAKLRQVDVVVPRRGFYQASSSEMFGLVQEPIQSEKTPFYPTLALRGGQALGESTHQTKHAHLDHGCSRLCRVAPARCVMFHRPTRLGHPGHAL